MHSSFESNNSLQDIFFPCYGEETVRNLLGSQTVHSCQSQCITMGQAVSQAFPLRCCQHSSGVHPLSHTVTGIETKVNLARAKKKKKK